MTEQPVQFMIRVKLPKSSAFHCSPSGDTEYDRAFQDAIFEVKPQGFEVLWPRAGHRWPEPDSEGFTFVPLFLSDEARALKDDRAAYWMDKYNRHLEQRARVRKLAEELIAILRG